MLRKAWMLPVLIGLAACAFATPESLLLSDFETEADLARFTVRKTSPVTRFELSSKQVVHGTSAAKIVFPKWKEGSEQWPAVILSASKGLPADWTLYDSIVVDVYNASESEGDLGIFVLDEMEQRISQHYSLAPGKAQTLRFPLQMVSRTADMARVKELHLFATRPPEEMTIIVDALRLECDLEPRLAEAAKVLARLQEESLFDSAELVILWERLGNTLRDLQSRASAIKTVDERKAIKQELNTLETRLRLEAPRAISEARMRTAFRQLDPMLPYACGFATSMEKVFPKDVPFNARVTEIAPLEMAGNETEAVQLLIFAFERNLKNVQVRVGPLTRTDGKATIPASSVKVSPVGFVKTEKPPYAVRYVGWHPDPILDFLTSFDVNRGEVQPVWIEIKTPPRTPAGEYYAEIIVQPADVPAARLGIRVKVWNFDLPKETHLRTAMTFNEVFMRSPYPEFSERIRQRYFNFILDHRFNPDNIYRRDPPAIEDLERWDRQGLNAFNLLYCVRSNDIQPGAGYPEERKKAIMEKLDAIIPLLKEKGLYKKAYLYAFDEIEPGYFNAMKDVLGMIKARYPDLLLMTTARDHTYGEATGLDCVDAWVPLTPYYDVERVKRARARGKQVWWYICIVPKEPYANWLIEYDAVDARVLMGLQTAKYQPDGFLYYATNRWPLTRKPITSGPYTDWPPASFNNCNGDGSLMCAGPDGPLTTIRLENFRDGLEDNEYFWLLNQEVERLKKSRAPEAHTALRQAQDALKIGNDLVTSMSIFTKSPEAIYAKRRKVAEAILAARKVRD